MPASEINVRDRELEKRTSAKIKSAAAVTGIALGTIFLVMRHIAKKQYPKSVYTDQPEEQNPMKYKKKNGKYERRYWRILFVIYIMSAITA